MFASIIHQSIVAMDDWIIIVISLIVTNNNKE